MRILRRLRHWWRFGARSAELDEELAFHREALEQDLIARGSTPEEARATARRAMGNETQMREASRAVWLWPWVEGVWQDAKSTIRSLRRSPAFSAGVILTFALGVGVNAAMFSFLDRQMFRAPALLRDPASVNRVYLYRQRDGVESEVSGWYSRHSDLVRWTTSFSDVAAFVSRMMAVGVGQDARERPVAIVSASFFDFFNAPPTAGRYFTADEDAPPVGAPVAVLSYAMWQAQYGGRPDVIGTTLQIGAVVYTIIGVTPRGFVGLWALRPPAAYVPIATYAASEGPADWATTYTWAFGMETMVRRKPGVNSVAASADLTHALELSFRAQGSVRSDTRTADQRIAALRPRGLAGPLLLERGPERSSEAKVATWLGGVTLIVLLIACANVASLLLARGLNRRREIALRIALGVSKLRLISQLLTESLLLAVSGAVLGLVLAGWLSSLLSASFLPGAKRASVADLRTLAFTAAVTLIVGVATSLFPVLQARRLSLTEDIASGGRSGTARRSRARAALLVVQGALSLLLLVGAGLFVRSLRNVRDVRLGYDADSVLVVELAMRDVRLDSAQTVALRRRLLDVAREMPGVSHATLQFAEPFGGMTSWPILVAGIDSTRKFGIFELNAVSPDYFATMGTRVLRGRGIERGDVAGATHVMVVGAAMARVLWPGEDPLGKCVRMLVDPVPCVYVVGVAEDIHSRSLGPETRNFYYYLAAEQMRPQEGGLFVRSAGNAQQLIEPLRRRLQAEMPGASYVTLTRMAASIEGVTRPWVMGANVFTAFGVLALVLAAVGLYSVIAYNVAQRRHELAVRMALGAAAGSVVRLVASEGMRLALYGVALGGAIAVQLGRFVEPLLFKQSPYDPVVFGIVIGVLLLVALVASAIPATRGARVDPNTLLRADAG